jgi:hypothetical protein
MPAIATVEAREMPTRSSLRLDAAAMEAEEVVNYQPS